jgi:hypothetical protein
LSPLGTPPGSQLCVNDVFESLLFFFLKTPTAQSFLFIYFVCILFFLEARQELGEVQKPQMLIFPNVSFVLLDTKGPAHGK